MSPSPSHDELSPMLAAWRVDPRPNPNFRPSVWRQIRQRAGDTWASYVHHHLVGWSLVAGIAVLAAGWTGHSIAQARLEASRDEMIISYLGGLDPRMLATPPNTTAR